MRWSWALSLTINMLLATGPGATEAGCGDYFITQDIYKVVEYRGGVTKTFPQLPQVTKLGKFVAKWRVEPKIQLAYAQALIKTSHPKALAVIGSIESQFHPEAVGKTGPWYGTYQVTPEHWGPVPTDILGQTQQADRIFTEILKMKGGRYHSAFWYYNGPEGRGYADEAMKRLRRL